MVYQVGDVISIKRYNDKDLDGSGVGVILKVYENRKGGNPSYFVKLLRNFTIPSKYLQNWKALGVSDNTGYYVRYEDGATLLTRPVKATYVVDPVSASAFKVVEPGNFRRVSNFYSKKYDRTRTEIFYNLPDTKINGSLVPLFVLARSVNPQNLSDVVCNLVTQKRSGETVTQMARRACARNEIFKLQEVAK